MQLDAKFDEDATHLRDSFQLILQQKKLKQRGHNVAQYYCACAVHCCYDTPHSNKNGETFCLEA